MIELKGLIDVTYCLNDYIRVFDIWVIKSICPSTHPTIHPSVHSCIHPSVHLFSHSYIFKTTIHILKELYLGY